ncbi:cellulose-binding domain-containing protein [Streptomyces cavernae]|uniref:cellulose-binding domain-containing protein n=1 Tax=Streptomyces cavernae TaxID=2259034 RepID=UPI000FEBE321|nr:cellulose-binding domain-containing protein [Streptomyces cavernae]
MPDLPTPQNAAEAALLSECWDAVLSYADLCTAGSGATRQLATEAFTHGMVEIQDARLEAEKPERGRRTPHLPMIPLLLSSVRNTAADWESRGHGHRLDPELRLWLNSEKAARYTGPPLQRPLALRGLRDMQEADAALLWWTEVEALPLTDVARRLGLDPAGAAEELAQVRAVFRDRCHRNHLDTPLDAECRKYARLLDALTRSSGAETPEDLSRHLAHCVECAEAAGCLQLHGAGLPAALVGGVVGWGGLAYLERRHRAVDAGLSGGRAGGGGDRGFSGPERKPSGRINRAGILAGAAVVSGLALAVSLAPFSGSDEPAGRQTVADPAHSPSDLAPIRSGSSGAIPTPTLKPPATARVEPADSDPGPEAQGKSSTSVDEPEDGETGSGDEKPQRSQCSAQYKLVNEWPDGFQGTITFTSRQALTDWRLTWKFRNGQQVQQIWNADFRQSGGTVTASAADYNRRVAAGGSVEVGFLASKNNGNAAPYGFTLNGKGCA